jgi:hypothetical protein
VLAGKFFRWNAGFQRHPKCDCVHIPTTEGGADGFKADVGPDDIKDLTRAQRRAIGDGADMNQVINAHRKGARSANGMFTSEGTTRRGWSSYIQREIARQRGVAIEEIATNVGRRGFVANYYVRRVPRRLTPEAIYRVAKSREEAVKMLYGYGYMVGNVSKIAAAAL